MSPRKMVCIWLGICLVVTLLLIAACNDAGTLNGRVEPGITSLLPSGATKVVHQGNGWFTFEWKGSTFLTKESAMYKAAMTQIITPPKCEEH